VPDLLATGFDGLLAQVAACHGRILFETLGLDFVAAGQAGSVHAARKPQEGGLDVAELVDIAAYLGLVDVHEQVGDRLFPGIGDPVDQVPVSLGIAFEELAAYVGEQFSGARQEALAYLCYWLRHIASLRLERPCSL
jgi:hypothetical protein